MAVSLMRVDADTGPNVMLAHGSGHHLIPLALFRGNVEELANSGLACACKNIGLVLDQTLIFKMTMTID